MNMDTIPETASPVNAETLDTPYIPADVMKFVIAVIEMRTLQREFFRLGKRMEKNDRLRLIEDAKAAERLVDRMTAGLPVTPDMLPSVRGFIVAVVAMRTLQLRFFGQKDRDDLSRLVAMAKEAERRVDDMAATLFLAGGMEAPVTDNLFAEVMK